MTHSPRSDDLSPSRGGSYMLPLVLGMLLVWRWMLPPENVLLGGTLWIAQCSLLLPVVWGLLQQNRERKIVWSALDTGLWIIVLGHWISFAWMLSSGGNLRTGFNLCWEWTAIGTTVFALRQAVREPIERQDLLRLLIAIGIAFAGIGLWQHYVSYRTTIADYERLRQQYDTLVSKAQSRGLSRLEQNEFQQLSFQIQQLQIPLEGPAREVFERRLADNRQPVGRWALTNSLGGVLAVTLILILPGIKATSRARWGSLLILLPVAVCLWKTQSRTAWVGALAGIFFYALREFSKSEGFYRRSVIGSLVAGSVLGGVVLVWGMSGLDRIDFDSNYALRSLQFRLQYWSGSLAMLADAPLFGSGPGNFREHYLQYKLAASSEQIADPHNSFLDLWANGGVVALAGGLLIAFLVLKRLVNLSPATPRKSPPEGLLSSPWMVGAELALLGLFLFELFTTGELDYELLVMALGLPFLDAVLQRVVRVDLPVAALIASVTLGIHLLGAGGTEMPGIVLFGAALLVISATDLPCCAFSRLKRGATIGVSLLLAAGMWWSTTAPTEASLHEMRVAQEIQASQNDVAQVRDSLLQAAESDPFDPAPWRYLAQLEYGVWQQKLGSSVAFERAIDSWEKAAERDPWSTREDHDRAKAYWERYQRTQEQAFVVEAVSWYERADAKRPHDERILSGLAFAAESAGMTEKSRNAAESAIKIHELSRKNGHWEKLLPDEILDRLKAVIAQ